MKLFGFAVFGLFALLLGHGNAQTLTTAQTIGKGKRAIFFSSNALQVKEFATLGYSYGQAIFGINDRLDLYVGPGFTTVFGRGQASVGVGANTNLLKSDVVSISTYNILSTPLNARRDGSSLLYFSSLVVSKNFKVLGYGFSGYTGYSLLAPIGKNRAEKLFTPPRTFHFVPVGVMFPLGKRFAVFVEYNHGNPLRTKSLGIAYSP